METISLQEYAKRIGYNETKKYYEQSSLSFDNNTNF